MRQALAAAGRWTVRGLVVGLLAGAGLTVVGVPASAHGQLAISNPVKGSTVTAPLERIELYFTEQPAFNAHFTVTAPSGVRVDAGWTPGTPKRLDKPVQEYFLVDGKWEPRLYHEGFPAMLAVSHLPERGTYTASYLSVASDGEPVKGTVTFRYDGPTAAAPAGWVPPSDGPAEALVQAVNAGAAGHGSGAAPAATPSATATAAGPDAADDGDGSGIGTWLLPTLLLLAVGVVVVAAARRKPVATPAPASNGPGRGRKGPAGRGAQGQPARKRQSARKRR